MPHNPGLEGVLEGQPLPAASYCCTLSTLRRGVAVLLLVICKDWHCDPVGFTKENLIKIALAQYKRTLLQAKLSVFEDSGIVVWGGFVCVRACVCFKMGSKNEKFVSLMKTKAMMVEGGKWGRAGAVGADFAIAPTSNSTSGRLPPCHQNSQSEAGTSPNGALSQMTHCPASSKLTAHVVCLLDVPSIHQFINQRVY